MAQRPTKRQQQAAATQEQLLAAARGVFESKGYQATTVGAITSAANTAHGTFYLYFRNKEDVFAKVMEEVAGRLYDEAEARWVKGNPRHAIEVSVRGYLAVFLEHRGLWRCLLEGTFASPAVETMWLDIRRRFTFRIGRNLERLLQEGSIRPLDPSLTAASLGSMVEWFCFTHFVLDEPPVRPDSVDAAVRTLSDLWFHAVYTEAEPEPERATFGPVG
jgi:AcrR family transcriptional regulator